MSTPSEPAVIPITAARTRTPHAAAPAADVGAQYDALRTGALLVDHPGRDLWTFRGPKALETLTGLVTNDLAALVPGHGCYAAALTAKGRIIADVRCLACDPAAGAGWLEGVTLVVDAPPRAADGWGALVRKFVNPRSAPYRHEAGRLRTFGLYGTHARDALAHAFAAPPSALGALPPYAHATITLEGAPLLLARVPDLGVDGFLVIVPAEHYDAAWDRVRGAAPGLVVGGPDAYTVARIETGYPEWGVDIDDTTIPQEANLDDLHAISYTKGCYTGQEVVARIHFRGHVNRHLRGLTAPPDAPALPTGAELVDSTGKVVGDVRSAARSPRLGPVAIAMVRREVPFGASLHARWEAGQQEVTVAALPFPSTPTATPA